MIKKRLMSWFAFWRRHWYALQQYSTNWRMLAVSELLILVSALGLGRSTYSGYWLSGVTVWAEPLLRFSFS